ncbi:PHP domain-containing protein, partial [Halomonas sp. MG34]|nr:PHP domain-containing protein [Halomonas sp. MG34]
MHTTASDGAQSLEEMVEEARRRNYRYIAITDHSKYLRVANGLDEDRLRKQRELIEKLNETYKDIQIFAGVEMDIRPDGTLDFSDDFLKEMDFVIVAIHSNFNQSKEKIMGRLQTALENPYVSLIAHPTGRLIGRREGYQVDMEQLIKKAKETNTALEINANPNRLDIAAEWARKAQEAGVNLAINTDAHNYQMLEHMKYGVGIARKGWIEKDTVMNTWSVEELKKYFSRNK